MRVRLPALRWCGANSSRCQNRFASGKNDWTPTRLQSTVSATARSIPEAVPQGIGLPGHAGQLSGLLESLSGVNSTGSIAVEGRQSHNEPNIQASSTLSLDGRQISIDPVFLRDACTCPLCVNPSSRQKEFTTVDIPADIEVKTIEHDGNSIKIAWQNDIPGYDSSHISHFTQGLLRPLLARKVEKAKNALPTAWHGLDMQKRLNIVDYNEYMTKPNSLHSVLRSLRKHGLVFLKNVPESEQSVVDIANRIGPLKNTFYGETWDVRSIPDAKNVAYTHQHLGFHMDLLYMKQPPRLQFLHCLRASTHGGASLFSDSYHAAQKLYESDMATFKDLCTYDTTYHYENDGHHYQQSRPIIQLRPDVAAYSGAKDITPHLEAVNWSPPFQGPFGGDYASGTAMQRWQSAAKAFRDLVELEDAIFERQMAPGECVIFDNQRVLHARTAFELGDVGKERWLKGAYLDWDPWMSKLSVLDKQFKSNVDKINDRMYCI